MQAAALQELEKEVVELRISALESVKKLELELKTSWRWRTGVMIVGFSNFLWNSLRHPLKSADFYRAFRGELQTAFGEASLEIGVFKRARQMMQIPRYSSHKASKNSALKIAVILDEFSMDCFVPEAELIVLSKKNWQEQLEKARPDFLLAESAWRGNGGEWQYVMTNFAKATGEPLRKLLKYCKSENIKTVFWNKEDPPNYEQFISVARCFDFIFTTDAGCVERYHRDTGHQNVYPLPFAAQPVVHNPCRDGISDKRHELCFAGTWYSAKHSFRQQQMLSLLLPSIKRQLHIFDRQYFFTKSDQYKYPPEFNKAIAGYLSYPQMVTAYKMYKLFLNVNSVADSETMFSRRVFEILACGTPVLSTYSKGIETQLGEHVIQVRNEVEAEEKINFWLKNQDLREKFAHSAYRYVMRKHTYQKRLQAITKVLGLSLEQNKAPLKTKLVMLRHLDSIVQELEIRKEKLKNNRFLDLELTSFEEAAFNRRNPDGEDDNIAKIWLSFIYNEIAKVFADGDIESILLLWIEDEWQQSGIDDLSLPFLFTDAAFVVKASHYVQGLGGELLLAQRQSEHRHASSLKVAPTLINLKRLRQELNEMPNEQEFALFLESGRKIYNTDRFNYLERLSSKLDPDWKRLSDVDLIALKQDEQDILQQIQA